MSITANAPAPLPDDNRNPEANTAHRFSTVTPPFLTQPKVDDRGPRIPCQRSAQPAARKVSAESLMLEISAALYNAHVLPQVKAEMWKALRDLAGDAIAASWLARSQQILNDAALSPAEQVATIIAAHRDPDWCDDCTPDDVGTSPIHSGLVGTVTDVVDGERRTVEVRVERNDRDGQPGKAFVALREIEGDRVEFGPAAAFRLADLYARAARLAIRDWQGKPL